MRKRTEIREKKKDSEHRNKSGKISKYVDRNQDTLDALDYDDLKKIPIILNENDAPLQVWISSIYYN